MGRRPQKRPPKPSASAGGRRRRKAERPAPGQTTAGQPAPGQATAGQPAPEPPAPEPPAPRPAADDFLVVGVGASAGGINALKEVCGGLPKDADIALVVILHLDPRGKSTLADLLAQHTAMRVRTAEDGTAIEPGNIYVIAPGVYLGIDGNRLVTTPVGGSVIRLPVDHFLRAIAGAFKDRAAGVVLSGTGSDGTLGVRSLKEEGGLTIAQEPQEAEYDGMPRSAIATGAVDLVLPVHDIPQALVNYQDRRRAVEQAVVAPAATQANGTLAAAIEVLKQSKKHDFTPYRTGTLLRRIARRMALNYCEKPREYVELLQRSTDEQDALFKDFTINVTGFFRDPEAFTYLEQHVIPDLVREHSEDRPIRVWVPGCSSGEEAYSIAMLVTEAIAASGKDTRLQVFATDVDLDALNIARHGAYPDAIESEVSAGRLRRFFTHEDHRYVVRPFLRESVIVSAQNLLGNAPFSNLDLVSCRNLLIYLRPEIQEKVLRLLHFALQPHGILFLGSSETVGSERNRFEAISAKDRIYRRVGRRNMAELDFPIAPGLAGHVPAYQPPGPAPGANLTTLAQRIILDNYAGASVLIDRRGEAVFFFGPVDRFLRIPSGETNQGITAMAREGLRAKLRSAIRSAISGDGTATVGDAFVRRNSGTVGVRIEIRPVASEGERFFLVTFLDIPVSAAAGPEGAVSPAEADTVARLEHELDAMRSELQSTIRDLEASNEELKASNEEATSMNEELQSTNEELETSKEELQSLNEEISTVNAELQERVEAQRKVANDLSNLLTSTDIATLFLDRDLHIRFFTPAAQRLFRIIGSDLGRPLADFVPQINDPALLDDAANVIVTLSTIQAEVQSADGDRWYIRRVAPYRSDDRIDGVVITFIDVSGMRIAERATRAAQILAESIVDTVREPLLVLDAKLKVVTASRSFHRTFGNGATEIKGRQLNEIAGGALNISAIVELVESALPQNPALEDVEVEIALPGGRNRLFMLNAREIEPEAGAKPLVLLALEDVTERRQTAQQIFEDYLDIMPDAVLLVDSHGVIRLANALVADVFGYHGAEIVGQPVEMLIPERLRERHRGHVWSFFAAPHRRVMGEELGLNTVGQHKDGSEIPLRISIAALKWSDGPMTFAIIRDVSRQRAVTLQVADAKAAAEAADALKSEFLGATSRNLMRPLQTIGLLSGILARTVVQREAQDVVARLEIAVGIMTDALNLLADVERLDRGTVVPQVTDFSIHDTIERMATEFARSAHARNLQFRIVPSAAVVRSDREIVDHILQNFVSNAIRFTSSGRVLVGCRREGDVLRLEVWDTGLGIPPDEIDRIFAEYHRVPTTPGEAEQGIGLGLYVVKRLADLLQHRIEVSSVPARGTMFALLLPLVAQPAQRREAPAHAAPGGGTVNGILVVSASAETRSFIELLLRLEGYDVLAVATASDAVIFDHVRSFAPVCVIVDERLDDEFSAVGLVHALRKAIANDTAFIVLTADASRGHVQEIADAGAFALAKPNKADDLIAHVGRLFTERGLLVPSPAARTAMATPPRAATGTDERPTVSIIIGDRALGDRLSGILSEAGHGVDIYGNASNFLAIPPHPAGGCIVLGDDLPDMQASDVIEALRHNGWDNIPVVLIAVRADIGEAVSGIRAGVVDVLEPPVEPARLLEAVERGLEQHRRQLVRRRDIEDARERLQRLTAREREIAFMLAAGNANKEIAARLGISQRTVENHRAQIRTKTGIRSVADLIRMTELVRSNRE